jgi:hypothetical protein
MNALSFLDAIDTGNKSLFLVKNVSEVMFVLERDTMGEIF